MKNNNISNIICFAPSDWWSMNPSCTSHIMKHLAKGHRVLYVNPFSSDLSGGFKKGMGTRICRKLKSLLKVIRRPAPGLYIFSPFFLPLQGRKTIDIINNILLRIQFFLLCRLLQFKQPVIWVENLRSTDLLDWFKPSLILYHVSDLFTKCRYTANRAALKQREKKILNSADLIICVSDPLYQRHVKLHDNVHYIPHGVDFEAFREAAESGRVLPEIKDIPKPIAGYFGTMTDSNDIDMMIYCAQNLKTVSFVFAGQVTGGDYKELFALPNVYYLGRLPYKKIPTLCANFDVCMLQWKMRDWIRNCNPLKLQEYLASGRAIVSIPIAEVEKNYSEVVSIAAGKKDYLDCILWELKNDTRERSEARIQVAKQHSWEKHAHEIANLINESLRSKYSQARKENFKFADVS